MNRSISRSKKIISQRTDTDFVWTRTIDSEETTLVIFHQNERGFATFLAGMGLIGDLKPVCRIFSKLMDIDAYNSAPDPTFPEWRLFETRNEDGRRYLILRITHAQALPESKANDHSWLYTYPIVRDITLELSYYGVDELVYLTTNVLQGAINYDYDSLASVSPSDVAVFDYINHEDEVLTTKGKVIEEDIILACPSWTFGSVFKNFCTNEIRGVWIVIGGYNGTTFIDSATSDTLLEYAKNVLGLEADRKTIAKLTDVLCDLEVMTNPANLDRLLANEMGDFFNDYI